MGLLGLLCVHRLPRKLPALVEGSNGKDVISKEVSMATRTAGTIPTLDYDNDYGEPTLGRLVFGLSQDSCALPVLQTPDPQLPGLVLSPTRFDC